MSLGTINKQELIEKLARAFTDYRNRSTVTMEGKPHPIPKQSLREMEEVIYPVIEPYLTKLTQMERVLKEILGSSSKEIVVREEYPALIARPTQDVIKDIQLIARIALTNLTQDELTPVTKKER